MGVDGGNGRPHDTGAGRDAPLSRPGWRGRTREWRPIAALLRQIGEGRGGVVLVEGRLGMGKTRLLHEAAEAAARAGIEVAHGPADEFGRLAPLAPLATALGEPELASPEPVPPGSMWSTESLWSSGSPRSAQVPAGEVPVTGAADLRLVLVERVRARLEERAGQGPLLIMLDDLQWVDPTTQLTLRSLVPELTSYPLGWIMARTSGIGDSAVDGLYRQLERQGAARVVLGPLDERAVAEVAADVLGAPPGPDVLAMAASADGNPFLLVELLRAREREGAAGAAPGRPQPPSAGRVRANARSRLMALSAPARQLLQVAGVLGRSFSVDDLAEILGEPVDRLLPRLTEAVRAGLVVPAVDRLEFRHDLLWQIATDMISKPVRTAIQRQAGEMLLRRGAVVPAATYFMRCARPGDARALDGLERAARAVLPYSPPSAADLAVRALELTAPADADLHARAVTAVEALTAAGRLGEAVEFARQALRKAPSGRWTDRLRYELALILLQSGRPVQAVTEAEDLLARPDLDPEVRGLAELVVFQGLMASHDFGRGRARANAILADRAGHADAAVMGALLLSAHLAWEEARGEDAFRDIDDAVRLASTAVLGARRAHPRLFLFRCLFGVGRYAEAESVLQDAAADVEAAGPIAFASAPAFFRACLALAAGRPDDAMTEAESGLKAADELGAHAFALFGLAVLAIVELRRGNVEVAVRHVERAESEQRAAHGAMYGSFWSTWAAATVAEAQNGPERAMEGFRSVYADVRNRRWMLMLEPNAAAWMTRTALAAGRRPAAMDVVETARQIAHDNPAHPVLSAAAAHAHGILHGDATALAEAGAQYGDPWSVASAAEDLGVLLIEDRKAAVEKFDEAAEGYRGIGALRDAARVRARLRNLGVRRRHWAYAERPSTGWDSLTDTERNVACLVAQGLTNRQVATQMFLSPHTVSFHLRQVFRKLGIASRVELARIAPEEAPGDVTADEDTAD
ncbi:helix-turn-helix transcriptional regulator [Actinomadura rugatobispora]|uniref:AAA family ATPase n=1 Tax=Actinomadura rugatobispora TaxID=1994 RepID=A0ABW1AJI1_9ACTN|nr:LuxR family transcriptional regulator [Actinomadura rugatobispora]